MFKTMFQFILNHKALVLRALGIVIDLTKMYLKSREARTA